MVIQHHRDAEDGLQQVQAVQLLQTGVEERKGWKEIVDK